MISRRIDDPVRFLLCSNVYIPSGAVSCAYSCLSRDKFLCLFLAVCLLVTPILLPSPSFPWSSLLLFEVAWVYTEKCRINRVVEGTKAPQHDFMTHNTHLFESCCVSFSLYLTRVSGFQTVFITRNISQFLFHYSLNYDNACPSWNIDFPLCSSSPLLPLSHGEQRFFQLALAELINTDLLLETFSTGLSASRVLSVPSTRSRSHFTATKRNFS